MTATPASVGMRVVSRLPASLRADYLSRTDRAIRDILESCGAPHMYSGIADALFAAPHRLGLLGGPQLVLPVRASPYEWPVRDPARTSAMFQQPSDLNPRPGDDVRIRRIPYTLADETTIAANSAITNATPANYLNGTGLRFIITHLTLSQNLEPLLANPSFSLRVIPAAGPPWSREKIPASAMLTYRPQAQISATAAFPLCVWHLDAEYLASPNHSFFCTADNPATGGGIQASLTFVAYKRDERGSPRIFSDTLALAASAIRQPFNSALFTGDGDFPFAVTDILMSSGALTTWSAAGNTTCPRYFFRSDLDREYTTRPTLAALMNTQAGNVGGFYRLREPQPVETGTGVGIEFTNNTGGQIIAGVGLVGYLEQAIQGRPGASA